MDAPAALRAWRGKRTLRQAADIIGCDPSYLSLLENRKLIPGDRLLSLRMHKVAGIPPDAWDGDDAHDATLDQPLTTVNGDQDDLEASATPEPSDQDPNQEGAA